MNLCEFCENLSTICRRHPSQGTNPPAPCGCSTTRKGARAAILQRIPSALAEIQGILCNQSRPALQPLDQRHGDRRGSGGKSTLTFPRRLCAAFDARKRPPTRGTVAREKPQQLCARGSMPLRRAKAASRQHDAQPKKEPCQCTAPCEIRCSRPAPSPARYTARNTRPSSPSAHHESQLP